MADTTHQGGRETWPPPVTLSGTHATLAPLGQTHATDLAEAAASVPGLWYTTVPTPEEVPAEIDRRRALPDMQPFAILDPQGRAIGMTTYMHTDRANARVEIGSTWLAREAQRSPVNTECKLMLLTHAFETLDCLRVEFRTHHLNTQSRRAIERLGAKLDGILRSHMVLPDGSLRDTVVYSILPHEWPAVRNNLTHRLNR